MTAGAALPFLLDLLSVGLIGVGVFFFVAGTTGLLRFPDVYCRLHALTKADNLGLGFLALGLAIQADEWTARLQLVLIWLLALAAAATISHILGRASLRAGIEPVLADPKREGGPG